MKNFRLLFLASAVAALFSSCAHQISYPLTASDLTSKRVNGSLKVEQFQDSVPREDKINVLVDGQYYRVNGREGYPGGQIAPGVSKQIAKHLDHSGLFTDVQGPNGGGGTDYTLSGTVTEFNATGIPNKKAENALVMGAAIGSLAGAGVVAAATKDKQTQVSSEVELRNLKLRDNRTGRTVWSRGTVRSSSSDDSVHFLQADAPRLYERADGELKKAVKQIVSGISSSRATR